MTGVSGSPSRAVTAPARRRRPPCSRSGSLRAGRTVVRTREPGGTEVGLLIRDIVLHHRGDVAPPRRGAAVRGRSCAPRRDGRAPGARARRGRHPGSLPRLVGRLPGRRPRARPRRGAQSVAVGRPRALLPDLTVLLDLDPAAARVAPGRRRQAVRPPRVRAGTTSTRACAPSSSRSPTPSPSVSSCSTPVRPADELAAAVRERVSALSARLGDAERRRRRRLG